MPCRLAAADGGLVLLKPRIAAASRALLLWSLLAVVVGCSDESGADDVIADAESSNEAGSGSVAPDPAADDDPDAGAQLDEPAALEVTEQEETELVLGCLIDQGISATLNPDGGIDFQGSSDEDVDRFQEGIETCQAILIDEGKLPAPVIMTPEQLTEEYERLIVLGDCVEAQGYEFPPAPSVEVFIESEGFGWHPYMGLGNLGEADFAQINIDCPQDLGK